ncbi:MAG: CoA transferase, partial [Candidatus Tectomicrobia bacterium]
MQQALLEGIRVLDFGRFIAAPYAGQLVADLGAEVVR